MTEEMDDNDERRRNENATANDDRRRRRKRKMPKKQPDSHLNNNMRPWTKCAVFEMMNIQKLIVRFLMPNRQKYQYEL